MKARLRKAHQKFMDEDKKNPKELDEQFKKLALNDSALNDSLEITITDDSLNISGINLEESYEDFDSSTHQNDDSNLCVNITEAWTKASEDTLNVYTPPVTSKNGNMAFNVRELSKAELLFNSKKKPVPLEQTVPLKPTDPLEQNPQKENYDCSPVGKMGTYSPPRRATGGVSFNVGPHTNKHICAGKKRSVYLDQDEQDNQNNNTYK